MNDLKFRFVNQMENTSKIEFVYTSINELESEDSWQGKINYKRLGINLFTGLKDKNGKEIYEGDWVRYETGDPDRPFIDETVEFNGGAFYPICTQPSNTFEIIGNIYEKFRTFRG